MKASQSLNFPVAAPLPSVYKSLFFDFSRNGLFTEDLEDQLHYLLRRMKAEGLTFIAVTMPTLGKALDVALCTGDAFRTPEGWKTHEDSQLPRFLNSIFKRLFNSDGTHKPFYDKQEADVYFLRQTLLLFSKMEVPEGRKSSLVKVSDDDALSSWITRATVKWEPNLNDVGLRELLKTVKVLLKNVFSDNSYKTVCDLREFQKNPWGRHGPGAVADREKGADKWLFRQWPGIPAALFRWAEEKGCPIVETLPTQPDARACVVPKDFRGPRVICIEPKENQFAQQGVMELLFRHIEGCHITRRSISFVDVQESQDLCFDKEMSTIDLKDASDYLSLRLARLVLPSWIFRLVTRYRTRYVQVPLSTGPVRVRPTSLATMGNATCFPLETLLFWAIARSAIYLVAQSWPKAQRAILHQHIRVFGDDIIVPSWSCDIVVDALTACGLVVNKEKTCHLSPVRESCGEWVFNNRSCRVVRIKTPGCEVKDLRSWLQVRDYAREFHVASYHATAEALLEISEEKYTKNLFRKRYNVKLQRMEIRVPLFFTQGGKAELVDYQALYAWLVHNDVTPYLLGARKRVKWGWTGLADFEQQ